MSLLEKFSSVEISVDKRISEDDRAFCLREQEAFDKSRPILQQIADLMASAMAEQKKILCTESSSYCGLYISDSGFRCDANGVYDVIRKRNGKFITAIVNYFVCTYKVKLDAHKIADHLIPAAPEEPNVPWCRSSRMTEDEINALKKQHDAYEKANEAWELSIRSLPLRYEQIVDEIFVQLGGFSFQEQAMNELLEKCWTAAHYKDWHNNILKENFEIKNDTIKFINYWCHFDSGWLIPRWRVLDHTKDVLDALAHYICGRCGEGSKWFPELFGYHIEGDGVFPSFHPHVKQIKLFKNGRVDIKFRSAAEAMEFANTYLRKNVKEESAA